MVFADEKLCGMSSEDFKEKLLTSGNIPGRLKPELDRSDLSFPHVQFGVVPNGMRPKVFLDIISLIAFVILKELFFPLLPFVQSFWSGDEVAFWLESAEIVDESRRSTISENLDGDSFLKGRAREVLTEDEMRKLNVSLRKKIAFLSSHIWEWATLSDGLRSTLCRIFGVALVNVTSGNGVMKIFMKQHHDLLQVSRPYESISPPVEDVEEVRPGREAIAKSFVGHCVRLRAKSREYFAPYTLICQSRYTGKSYLLSQSWEIDGYALFIIRINCAEHSDKPETRKLVEYMLRLRTQEEIEQLLAAILQTFLEISVDPRTFFLKKPQKLSHSMEDLKLKFEDIKANIGNAKLDELQETIANMQVVSTDSDVVKKVIPIVAFDEADVLSANSFDFEIPAGPQEIEHSNSVNFDTFRMIRRVLHSRKDLLGQSPFVFVAASAISSNFVKTPLELADVREVDGSEADPETTKLFPLYFLKHAFDILRNQDLPSMLITTLVNWVADILSFTFLLNLIRAGRPKWEADLEKLQERNNVANSADVTLANIQTVMEIGKSTIAYSPDAEQKERIEAALEIAGLLAASRYSIEVSTSSIYERKMAILLDIDESGNWMHISYPPEPVLGIAALGLLHEYPLGILKDLENSDPKAFTRHVGDIGEFIAKILILLRLPEPKIESLSSPVRSLLQNILLKKDFTELKNWCEKDLLDARVCFSNFVAVAKLGNDAKKVLGAMVRLNAALTTPPGFPGIDLIIPMILADGSLGAINVQVKNKAGKLSDLDDIKEKLCSQPISQGVRRLNLIINVHPSGENNFELLGSPRDPIIVLEGWNKSFGQTLTRFPQLESILCTILLCDTLSKPTNCSYGGDPSKFPSDELNGNEPLIPLPQSNQVFNMS